MDPKDDIVSQRPQGVPPSADLKDSLPMQHPSLWYSVCKQAALVQFHLHNSKFAGLHLGSLL